MLNKAESVTPIEVAELAVQVQDRHLVGLPRGSDMDNPFGMPVDEPVVGRARGGGTAAHASLSSAYPSRAVLVMPSLIHLRYDRQSGLDIPLADIVLLLAHGDGGRAVITRDGFEHAIEPSMYARGPQLVGAIDSMVPADLRVRLPAREDVPQPEVAPKKTVWKSVKNKVAPIAATLPLSRTPKTAQFDAAHRLNDGLS
ncbi:MAG TPA: hypothetical protein VF312_06150 [Propionibacteriaceae bacterium]